MLKKLMSLLLVFTFANASANMPKATSVEIKNLQALNNAFNDLNFSLSVEWDQTDRKFYNKKMKDFQDTVKKLQKKGLKTTQILELAKNQIKNKSVAKEMDKLFKLIEKKKLSEKDARDLLLKTLSKGSAEGANFRGRYSSVYAAAAVILLLTGVVLLAAAAASSSTGVVVGGGACYDEYICIDYYDSWGFYWYTDCFWDVVCY